MCEMIAVHTHTLARTYLLNKLLKSRISAQWDQEAHLYSSHMIGDWFVCVKLA